VLRVLYLIFNEGYAASSGGVGGRQLQRLDLAEEAIRLTRMLHRLLPGEDEVELLAEVEDDELARTRLSAAPGHRRARRR
jgi:RNA polymerase sigma-70 factor (ECF subfamily)